MTPKEAIGLRVMVRTWPLEKVPLSSEPCERLIGTHADHREYLKLILIKTSRSRKTSLHFRVFLKLGRSRTRTQYILRIDPFLRTTLFPLAMNTLALPHYESSLPILLSHISRVEGFKILMCAATCHRTLNWRIAVSPRHTARITANFISIGWQA